MFGILKILFVCRMCDRWDNGMRHGQGVCLFADGTMYQGGWVSEADRMVAYALMALFVTIT